MLVLDTPGLDGIVLRYGRRHGPGTWMQTPDGTAEVKPMRTHPDFLGIGAAACLLDTRITEATRRGVAWLTTQTGREPAFEPVLALYR